MRDRESEIVVPYRPCVSCNSSDDEDEDEGDDNLEEEGFCDIDGRDGDAAGLERAEDAPEGEGSADRAQGLGKNVSGHLSPREMAENSESECDGRVEVCPGDVPG